MITRLYDRVQLSIYSTRALFYKYFVAMMYTRIFIFGNLSKSPHSIQSCLSLLDLYSKQVCVVSLHWFLLFTWISRFLA